MTRHFVPNVHVRQMIARRKFQQGMQMGDEAMFLVSGCLDAPDVFVSQWDSVKQDWVSFNIRED